MIKHNENQFWFCFDKVIDITIFTQNIYTNTGLKLMANLPTDTVNGYINGFHFPLGYVGKCMHGLDLDGTTEHTCLQIILYDSNESPNYIELRDKANDLIKSRGHKSFVKKEILTKKRNDEIILAGLDQNLLVGGIVKVPK